MATLSRALFAIAIATSIMAVGCRARQSSEPASTPQAPANVEVPEPEYGPSAQEQPAEPQLEPEHSAPKPVPSAVPPEIGPPPLPSTPPPSPPSSPPD